MCKLPNCKDCKNPNCQSKNILCKSCSSNIGTAQNNILSFNEMKSISKIEVSNNETNVKCRSCNSWNLFTENTQSINHKKRSQEILFDK